MPLQEHCSNVIWQIHCQHDPSAVSHNHQRRLSSAMGNIDSAVPRPMSHRQWHRVQNLEAWHVLPRLAIQIRGSPLTRLGELKECHSNRRPDRLRYTTTDASPILNRGEHIMTNKIIGHFIKPVKLYSWLHFLPCQYLCINLFLASQYTASSIITNQGLHVLCYTAPALTACHFFLIFVYCLCAI
jgi:hypothetical protein